MYMSHWEGAGPCAARCVQGIACIQGREGMQIATVRSLAANVFLASPLGKQQRKRVNDQLPEQASYILWCDLTLGGGVGRMGGRTPKAISLPSDLGLGPLNGPRFLFKNPSGGQEAYGKRGGAIGYLFGFWPFPPKFLAFASGSPRLSHKRHGLRSEEEKVFLLFGAH